MLIWGKTKAEYFRGIRLDGGELFDATGEMRFLAQAGLATSKGCKRSDVPLSGRTGVGSWKA
jgi:hypothetical protein